MSDECSDEMSEFSEVEVVIVVSVGSTSSSLNPFLIGWGDGVVLVGSESSESGLELIGTDLSVTAGVNMVEDGSELSFNIILLSISGGVDVVVSDESSDEVLELWKVKRMGAISISCSGSSSDPSSVSSGDSIVYRSGIVLEGSSKLSWLDFSIVAGVNFVEDSFNWAFFDLDGSDG